MTLRALLVDDEPLARRRLRALLASEPRVEIVGECSDGSAALEAVPRLAADLLFLDVEMPGLDGFDVVQLLQPAVRPAVIFVTAYDRYAMRAFDAHAADYLLKPFARARLSTAVTRAAALVGTSENPVRLQTLIEAVRAGRPLERFLVKAARRAYAVRVEDVETIEAADHYIELRTAQGPHLVREPLGHIERRLDPLRFARIHRSTIVSLDRIREWQRAPHGELSLVLASGRIAHCSRTYAAALIRALSR